MHKKIIFGILVLGLMFIALSLLIPPGMEKVSDTSLRPSDQFLPWQIEPTADGSIRVFGLTLGESTLQQAEDLFQGGARVSLFVAADGQHKVEAYFDKVILGGFSAQLVLVMALGQEQQAAMFRRGVRISSLAGGGKKVALGGEDLQTVLATPIDSIAYLTRTRLDDELLRKRFGEPAQRIREPHNTATHWLYPERGLDVTLHDEGRAVLQYIAPRRFPVLMAPLLEGSTPP